MREILAWAFVAVYAAIAAWWVAYMLGVFRRRGRKVEPEWQEWRPVRIGNRSGLPDDLAIFDANLRGLGVTASMPTDPREDDQRAIARLLSEVGGK